MNDVVCPLCLSSRHIEIKRTKSNKIINEYKNKFNVDISRYFPNDDFGTYKCVECGLQTHHPALPGEGEFYDQMQMNDFYYESNKPEFDYALNIIMEKNPGSILEIGCGEGLFLQKLTQAYNVRASEYSQKSISKLEQAGIQMDTPDNRYDFVMYFQVLEHVKDVRGFLDFSINKLNTNGTLLITVPNNDSPINQEGTILDFPPHHMTQWPKRSLEKIADIFNMEIEDHYTETPRLEHVMGLISTRRNKFRGSKTLNYLSQKLGRFVDRIILPYHIDKITFAGDTHGIVLRKLS